MAPRRHITVAKYAELIPSMADVIYEKFTTKKKKGPTKEELEAEERRKQRKREKRARYHQKRRLSRASSSALSGADLDGSTASTPGELGTETADRAEDPPTAEDDVSDDAPALTTAPTTTVEIGDVPPVACTDGIDATAAPGVEADASASPTTAVQASGPCNTTAVHAAPSTTTAVHASISPATAVVIAPSTMAAEPGVEAHASALPSIPASDANPISATANPADLGRDQVKGGEDAGVPVASADKAGGFGTTAVEEEDEGDFGLQDLFSEEPIVMAAWATDDVDARLPASADGAGESEALAAAVLDVAAILADIGAGASVDVAVGRTLSREDAGITVAAGGSVAEALGVTAAPSSSAAGLGEPDLIATTTATADLGHEEAKEGEDAAKGVRARRGMTLADFLEADFGPAEPFVADVEAGTLAEVAVARALGLEEASSTAAASGSVAGTEALGEAAAPSSLFGRLTSGVASLGRQLVTAGQRVVEGIISVRDSVAALLSRAVKAGREAFGAIFCCRRGGWGTANSDADVAEAE